MAQVIIVGTIIQNEPRRFDVEVVSEVKDTPAARDFRWSDATSFKEANWARDQLVALLKRHAEARGDVVVRVELNDI
jgi:hypothetical protein